MMRQLIRITILTFLASSYIYGQDQSEKDALYIKSIHDYTLQSSKCYDWLETLSEDIGGRLAGSANAAAAVWYTKQILEGIGVDSVYLQECTVPHWKRGNQEVVKIVNSLQIGTETLRATSLGNSKGTSGKSVVGEVLEVLGLDELDRLADSEVKGKIVFFNRPMDPTLLNTFHAYGGAVDQRAFGPAKAAKKGAIGVVVRSMTTRLDDIPHTGTTIFPDEGPWIPAMAISTLAANQLSDLLKNEKISVMMKNEAGFMPDEISHNVIAEWKGSTNPEEIIVVGGHLDSWDIGGGAHDDGAGCVHAMQVIHTLVGLGYKPKRTIRCVLFMNEENGLQGGNTYAAVSNQNKEYHMAAIESDSGGFTPRGFTCDGEQEVFSIKFPQVRQWIDLLGSYGLTISKGGGGADIGPLKPQGGLLFGFKPDSQRYFDYHHSSIDRIDAVNKRELELGAAAITSLVYLLDKYGLE